MQTQARDLGGCKTGLRDDLAAATPQSPECWTTTRRSFVRVISPSQKPLRDNTQHSQEKGIHAPGGSRTHILSKRAAAVPRLRTIGQSFLNVGLLNQLPFERESVGCGRKNTSIWEGHSFCWGARTVVESTSSNSGVHAVFSVDHGVAGRTSCLYCWGANKKWRVAGSNDLPQSKGLRTAPRNFGSCEGDDRTGSCCHYTWNDSQGHGHLPRGYIGVSIFKAATWGMFCSKHVDVKRHSVWFPEIEKHLPYLLWFWIHSLLK